MAHTKVSIIRKWYGKVPLDKSGKPVPQNLWPKRRKYSWEVRWYGSDGTRYSKSFKGRKEAEEYAQPLQDKVDKGKADRPKSISISQFTTEHKKLMTAQVAYTTLLDQTRALKLLSNHVGDDRALTSITPRDAESFINARFSEGLAVASVNKDIRTLKALFNLAIEPRGYLPEGTNPFAKIKQRKMSSKPPCYVGLPGFSKVFDASGDLWWRTLLALAYTSAGRKNELLNLMWSDIDFERLEVRFVAKALDESTLEWEPKDHESRAVPIPPQTIQLLANLQSQASEKNVYVFFDESRLNHILARRDLGKWTPKADLVNNALRDLKVICRRAAIEEFTLHDLRRSCITNWAQKLPIHVVQRLAGHSSIETTRKYYLSVQKSDLAAARRLQGKLMDSLTNF